ncbi:helix-turn-helix transcriptional regulator [Metabacillus schmidteae]|uniref:helix-turn-helix transcriptional regulator n=1 Tax=Metabacillus schmidteae TaxID=2730405 RepID=UPI00158BB56C|nr:WYL domain-containing protein [Metabacillus schmidteae]
MSEAKTGRRLLALKEIFLRDTDENKQFSIKELVEKLKIEIPECTADAKTVKRYIQTLRATGFDIIENVEKYGEIYYSHQDRLFESYQLRLLIDPILSARFITEEEKKNIVKNVKKLTSKHVAKTLPDPIVYQQSINQDYQLIKLHIDKIHKAISESKMITFQYGDFDIHKQFQLRHNAKNYQIKPFALIWESDFYYLIGEDIDQSPESNPRNYRLDRMRNVIVTENRFVKKQQDISTYVHNSFHMFGGEDQWITLQFTLNQLVLNGVIDKFGIDADIRKGENNTFILKAKAKQSMGLKGWILGWGSYVKVLSPTSLVQEINKEIEKMAATYKE